jgi:tetratricopeptide (TPR) repeat protein
MADRYAYLPAIGLFVAAVWGVHDLLAARGAQRFAGAFGAAAVALLAMRSAAEVRTWRDSETVFRRALAVTGGNALAHTQLARVRADAGDPEGAVAHLREATRLEPYRFNAHNNLANALRMLGRTDEALASYRQALALMPTSSVTHYNYARALAHEGRLAEAAEHYRLAIENDAALLAAQLELANLLVLSEPASAIPHYRNVAAAQPDVFQAHYGLAHALAATGRLDEAIESYERARALRPGSALLLNDLGIALFSAGRFEESVRVLGEAVRADPEQTDHRFNLARALAAAGRTGEALAELETVLAVSPRDAGALELRARLQRDARP